MTDEEGGFAHRDIVDSRVDLLSRFHAHPAFPLSRIRQLFDSCCLGELVVREEGVVGVAPLGGEQGADERFRERYGDKDQVVVSGKERRDGFCEHGRDCESYTGLESVTRTRKWCRSALWRASPRAVLYLHTRGDSTRLLARITLLLSQHHRLHASTSSIPEPPDAERRTLNPNQRARARRCSVPGVTAG